MEIRTISLGALVAHIARLDNGIEVIPMTEAEMLLGTDHSLLSHHLAEFSESGSHNSSHVIGQLKKCGVISSGRGRPPRMLSKEEFQYLVKKVNTPQAWAIYNTLWGEVAAYTYAADNGVPDWARRMEQEMHNRFDKINGIFSELDNKTTERFDQINGIFSELDNKTTERFDQIDNTCRGLRDEVDELRATLNLVISDEDGVTIKDLIKRIKQQHSCDGRTVVGMVRKLLNVGSIYDIKDTRKVINILRNILGEGIRRITLPE